MSQIQWAADRGRPGVPVVPKGRIPPRSEPAKRSPLPPPALPPVSVSPFGLSFTYGEPGPKLPTIMGIIREVAAKHGLTADDLTGEQRTQHVVVARHEAMWKCAQNKRWSLTRIGNAFAKDHTTVLNGIRRHEQRMQEAD